MATPAEVAKCIVMLGMAYPKEAEHYKDPKVMALWADMLSDLPGELLQQAVRECIASLAWFPKIAEVRHTAIAIEQAASPIPDAHTAWAEVLCELERVGHYSQYGQPLAFSHPLVREVVEQFQWLRLCSSENLVADRAQFIQAYNSRLAAQAAGARRLAQTRRFIELAAQEHSQLPPGEPQVEQR